MVPSYQSRKFIEELKAIAKSNDPRFIIADVHNIGQRYHEVRIYLYPGIIDQEN